MLLASNWKMQLLDLRVLLDTQRHWGVESCVSLCVGSFPTTKILVFLVHLFSSYYLRESNLNMNTAV